LTNWVYNFSFYSGFQLPLKIRETKDAGDPDWLSLRGEFIPELGPEEQLAFLQAFAKNSRDFRAFIASDEEGEATGFAEVSLRSDYVNGCHHRPALFLEGIYVRPSSRGRGIARAICDAAGQWGRRAGCREFASDVYIDDIESLAAHTGLGFEETERVVYFCKKL